MLYANSCQTDNEEHIIIIIIKFIADKSP